MGVAAWALSPQFILPSIPTGLTAPADRATFLLLHFWDNMDFDTDSALTAPHAFEQNFADFMSVFPIVSDSVAALAVENLLQKASANKEAYQTVSRTAEKYLYEPESPVYNEEYYRLFLLSIEASPVLTDAEKSRVAYQLETVNKNRAGSKASNFSFTLPDGTLSELYASDRTPFTLLMFIDPDCDHCRHTVERIKKSTLIDKLIAGGELQIIAVYSGDERGLWQRYVESALPPHWTAGYDPGTVIENDIYAMPAFPTVYLLDSNLNVAAKNISFSDELLEQLMHRPQQK